MMMKINFGIKKNVSLVICPDFGITIKINVRIAQINSITTSVQKNVLLVMKDMSMT